MTQTAVGYVRYSDPGQDYAGTNGDSDGYDSQLAEVQTHAEAQGYELDDVYKDVLTGRRADRMEYTRLLDRLTSEGDVDVIITTEVSRIGRDQGVAAAWLVAKAEAMGVTVETTTGSSYDFERPEDKLRFRILSAVAEYEIDMIQHRMQRGKKAGAQRGYWTNGTPPTGYKTEGPQGRKILVPVEPEATHVRQLYHAYLDLGSFSRVADAARSWDTEGPTHRVSIGRILRSPVYKGDIVYDDEEHDGQHDGLVSEHVWTLVREERERDAKGGRPPKD